MNARLENSGIHFFIYLHTGENSLFKFSYQMIEVGTDIFQVRLTNSVLHFGQVIPIFPFPLGTRIVCLHCGQR